MKHTKYYNDLVDQVMRHAAVRRSTRRTEDLMFAAALLRMLVGRNALETIWNQFDHYPVFCQEVKKQELLSDSDYDLIFNKILADVDFHDDASDLVALVRMFANDDNATEEVLLYGNYRDFTRIGDDTGSVVDELAIKILQGNQLMPVDTFFSCCSGQGNILAMAVANVLARTYCGQDISEDSNRLADIRLRALKMPGQIYCGDVLKNQKFLKTAKKFDRIYGNIPFVGRTKGNDGLKGYGLPLTAKTSAVWDYVDIILKYLSDTGRAVVMVQTGSLFKLFDRQIRQKLIEDKKIEGVITLPKGLYSYSPLRMSLIVLSNGNEQVHMVNMENLFTKGRRFVDVDKLDIDALYDVYQSQNHDSHSTMVSLDEIREKNCKFLPAAYLAESKLEFPDGQKFSQVCQVIRGKQLSGKELDLLHDENSNYGYVNSSNVDMIITLENCTRIRVDDPEQYKQYEIQNGDIVLASRSTIIKAGVAEVGLEGHLIASTNVLILRPFTDKILPTYLMMLLLSKTGEKLLDSIQTGARIITITPRALADLVIPVPPMVKQKNMAQLFRNHMDKIIKLKSELEESQKKLGNLFEECVSNN